MKLHVFVDGTWLFRACSKGKVLSSKTETPDKQFNLDFEKLNKTMCDYIESIVNCKIDMGDCYISTSILEIPLNIDDLPLHEPKITIEMIEKFKKGVFARNVFVDNAVKKSIYKDTAIFRPSLKSWMVPKIANGTFQEKQVDTTVVALLVKYAFEHPNDYHAVLTGDSDILPAIRVAYPEYTRNVVVVSTDPDELKAECRQSSFSINSFKFAIPPLFLQDHVEDIVYGEYIYKCKECNKIFIRERPVNRRPYCKKCEKLRT